MKKNKQKLKRKESVDYSLMIFVCVFVGEGHRDAS